MVWTNSKNTELLERARKVIPNGMYGHEAAHFITPEHPQFFERAKGARVWDADGNEYVDYMCAFGPNLFGYGHDEIDAGAIDQLQRGDTMTGPGPVMVDLAEKFVGMIDHADWALFCKNGTDATTMAMTIARAHTGKRKILLASGVYHGAAPWCVPFKRGVLPEQRAHQIYYTYNDADSLRDAVKEAGDDLAGIFATPFFHEAFTDQHLINPEYAKACREICDEQDALLIVDEVRTGFRLSRDCAWTEVGVKPDLSSWGKAIANGHCLSALLGADKARQAAGEIFVTGSFWFSAAPMAASLKTLDCVARTDYLERTIAAGTRLRAGIDEQAARHGVEIRQTGPVQMPQILFADDPDFRVGSGWTMAALRKGAYLHPWHNMFISAAHHESDVDATLDATEAAFVELKRDWKSLTPTTALMELLETTSS